MHTSGIVWRFGGLKAERFYTAWTCVAIVINKFVALVTKLTRSGACGCKIGFYVFMCIHIDRCLSTRQRDAGHLDNWRHPSELRTVGVSSSVRHGKQERLCVLDGASFSAKAVRVHARAHTELRPCALSWRCWATCLNWPTGANNDS